MSGPEVGLLTGLGVPVLSFLIIIAVQWGGIRSDLKFIKRELVTIHDQMRIDRDATDRRLRWLEENVWNRHSGLGH